MTEKLPTVLGLYRDRVDDLWVLIERNGAREWHYLDPETATRPEVLQSEGWDPFSIDSLLSPIFRTPERTRELDEFARVRRLLEGRYFTASEHVDVVALRELILDLATEIWQRVPEGRNRAEALLRLEDVQMRANRGLFATEPHR